jgi:REP element-mobilizing transposase RayT
MARKWKRVQEGVIHCAFRGNGKFFIFLSDEDFVELLKIIEKFAKATNSIVYEFVIMSNHCHLLVKTECVTKFMTAVVHSYTINYNKRHGWRDRIFKSPFISSLQPAREDMVSMGTYILRNPVLAGICNKVEEYKWSSVGFHCAGQNLKVANSVVMKNKIDLHRYISVDTSYFDKKFKTLDSFLFYANTTEIKGEKRENIYYRDRVDYGVLMNYVEVWLNRLHPKRLLGELSTNEALALMKYLRSITYCTFRQLANIFRVEYEYVRKMLT